MLRPLLMGRPVDLVASPCDVYTPQPVCAGIAQLVERVIRNDEVVGSIPISGTILQAEFGQRFKGWHEDGLRRSWRSHIFRIRAINSAVECHLHTVEVSGSIPL